MLMIILATALTLSQILAAYYLFAREAKKNSQLEHQSDLLALRLKMLKKDTELLQEGLQNARIMRHDLRHHYRLLYVLLGDGDKETALEHIEREAERLWKTKEKAQEDAKNEL